METFTIRDIARICKVSTSTVSRAINNDPGINQKTKERVLRVVKEFHFVPNNSARNLKRVDSNTVALISKGIGNSFFQSMYPLFEIELLKHGFQFILSEIGNDRDSGRAAAEIAKERRLKGIVFLGGMMEQPEILINQVDVPYVLCTVAVNADHERYGCSSVAIDDEKESFRIVDYLCKRGHKRIAIISGYKDDNAVGMLRIKGYEEALKDNGIEVCDDLIGYMPTNIPDYTIESGYAVMKELLSRNNGITAVFATSDLTAFGAYRAIAEAGLKIPDDISVVGFDGIDMTRYMVPSLTTVRQPRENMVKASVDLLMKEIEGESDTSQLVYDAEIIERESVRTAGD